MANDIRKSPAPPPPAKPAPNRSAAPARGAAATRSGEATKKTEASPPPTKDRATVSPEAKDKPGASGAVGLNTGLTRNFSGLSKDQKPELSVQQTLDLHNQNPVAGNQAITDRYYHEAQSLNEMLGGTKDNPMAAWPAFATQASNSAGTFIRDDGVPIFDYTQQAVTKGNREVFADIAPHYDAYIDTFSQNPKANFDDWMKTQNFQDKPQLAESFQFLERARTTDDPDKKQEYLLASNALAGAHEQNKLDGRIDEATSPFSGSDTERSTFGTITNEKPTLYLPTGKGSGDLQAIDTSQKIEGNIPPALQTIDDPQVRQALQSALGNPQADVSSGQAILNNSGTEDWSKLPDRMRTITALMVTGQNNTQITEYPLDYNPPPAPSTLGHVESTWNNFTDILGGIF